MSDVPFGFSDDDSEPGEDKDKNPNPDSTPGPPDPLQGLFSMLSGASGKDGAPDLGALFQHLGQMFSWSGGPVNWDLANQAARGVVASAGDRSVSSAERQDVSEAFRLADTWLDTATEFSATGSSPRTWSRAEWIEGTQTAWKELVEPVATRVSEAMSSSLPEEMTQAAGPLVGIMQQLGVAMWGTQVGQSIGSLAGEVCGSTDIGIPLAEGHPALLPANITKFGSGLGIDGRDVTVYLALREAAYLRLYAHTPWLRPHLLSLIEEYARNVNVDTEAVESKLRDLDPENPEELQEAMNNGLFDLPPTPAQQAALDRLELALALVEGWVDDVVTQACSQRLPSADALGETVRRRRAIGGPAEQTFATLVGLKMRPRQMREASAFWAAVREARGTEGRDAVWAHPDLAPSGDDLANPDEFLHRDELLDTSGLDDTPRPPSDSDTDDDSDKT